MILNKRVSVKVGTKSFSWYKEKGYDPKCGEMLEISIDDITTYSSAIVDVECQLCKTVKKKKYFDYKYSINTSRDGKYYCSKCAHINKGKTNLSKYGNISPLGNKEIIKLSKKTLLKIYGVDNISKVDYIKEDRKIFMKNNPVFGTDKFIDIILEKYNTNNVSKLDWVKDKKKQTTMKNYGVENPSQSAEVFEKSQISGKKIKKHTCGLFYRGTYEKDFLDFCLLNDIKVEKGISIKFNFNNKRKVYHSDFYISNKNIIVEIKSSYYYDKYRLMNEIKKEETIKNGYNHIFIIDKDYTQFLKIVK